MLLNIISFLVNALNSCPISDVHQKLKILHENSNHLLLFRSSSSSYTHINLESPPQIFTAAVPCYVHRVESFLMYSYVKEHSTLNSSFQITATLSKKNPARIINSTILTCSSLESFMIYQLHSCNRNLIIPTLTFISHTSSIRLITAIYNYDSYIILAKNLWSYYTRVIPEN